MAALAATTTASARTAVAASRGPPFPGWMASASSCSSSATAPASQDRSRGGKGRAERPEGCRADTYTYGASTARARASAATGVIRPVTAAMVRAAIHSATVPSKRTTRRCSLMSPATTAPSPIRAARLNTLEPRTTPVLTSCWPWASAVTAEVTSGVSAASAATRPRSASDSPSRAPTRSSRTTRTALAPRLSAAAVTNTATAQGEDIIGCRGRPDGSSRCGNAAQSSRRATP